MATDRVRFKYVLKTKEAEAFFTRRSGGVSSGVYAGFNLGYHVGDNTNKVRQNRLMLARSLEADNLVFMHQVHGSEVVVIDTVPNIEPTCDALITNKVGIGLCVLVADCAAILLYDKVNLAIGAVHAGRKGICERILTKTVNKMQELYGTNPADLDVFVSPFIKADCYNIGDMDLGEFNKFKVENNFDIEMALRDEMQTLGITEPKFDGTCNHCDDNFFSYRRDKVCGRFAGVISMKDKSIAQQ